MQPSHWLAVIALVSSAAVAQKPQAKPREYTHTQHNGSDVVHVTKLAFTPLPEWKERIDKHSDLPDFVNASGDVVALLTDISVFGKTPAEHIDSGVRSMFIDSKDASKITRTDRGNGRWWVVDHNAKMRANHAALFVPDDGSYFAVCDIRSDDPKQLDALAKVCDSLAVKSFEDRKP
jgi:hypothetical protein